MAIEIRPMALEDWDSVRAIYLQGLATGEASFETVAPSWEKWDLGHLRFGRLVAISASDGSVRGWAALGSVSSRAVYEGVAEVSVYVAKDSKGQGVGKTLLDQLIAESENEGIWTLQASVFPENVASLALHKACGFREVGLRKRIGRRNGIWRDTVLLERRSKLVGND
jgi:L-amino acid N-acyltransferase YncA